MPLIDLTNLGLVGVDLFFVLSGFIILYATVGRGRSCRDYFLARFRRIYLPYLPVGLVMAGYVFIWLPHSGHNLLGWLASITLLPVAEPALNVAWTLQHEVVFYAFVAIGLFSGWWRTGLAIWALAILSFQLSGKAAPIGFQPIDSEFLMGITAWAAWKSGNRQIRLAASAALCLLAAGIASIGPVAGIDRSGPIACAALFAAMLPWLVVAEQRQLIGVPRVLGFLGDASYSIYLVHVLPLLLLFEFLRGLGWTITLPVIGLAGLAAGIIYHVLVERPVLKWSRTFRQP